MCETSFLTNRQNTQKTCKIKFISLDTSVWHSLLNINSWLFYTKSDFCTITCLNSAENHKIEIFGVGRMTISSNCDVHTENSIHLPMHSTNTNVNLDLIAENQNNNVLSYFTKTLL
jgi:hypothetical protein